jgi:F0F1-type ATP synthase assembly protein I
MQAKNKPPKPLNTFIEYSSLGFQMMGALAIGAWLGHQADKWLENSRPLLTLLGMLLGVGSSILLLIRGLNKKNKE